MDQQNTIHHYYYVDEAGDLTLFNKKGQPIIGTEGVSKVFMVGVVQLFNPEKADIALNKVRSKLLDDPYFKGVPSMKPDSNKTALYFHACKDLPEVRREIFRLLPQFEAKVQVVIRRKDDLLATAQSAFQKYGKKLSPNDIYDDLIKRLFKNLLHKADENHIIIARRGKSDRLKALKNAVSRAKSNFEKKWKIITDSRITIQPAYPHEFAGLQIIDYYLWALQRLYEKNEDRFFNLLASNYRLIMDIDDKRNKAYGEWYTDKNPLTFIKIKPATG